MTEGVWPPPKGLCTPTISAADQILSPHSTIIIHAPAATVWKVLLNTSEYPEWNTFCPKVIIHSQPDGTDSSCLQLGTSMTFNAVMNPAKPNSSTPAQMRVVDISTPDAHSSYVSKELLQQGTFTQDLSQVYRISWKVEGGIASKGLRSERFHEIIIKSDDQCEVRSWEPMAGIFARGVKWTYGGVLNQRFNDWAEGLKRQSEKLSASNVAM